MSLTLYFHPLSSFCQKVLVALYENDTPFTPHLVDLGDAAARAAFVAVWPVGKFPVLVDARAGRTIPESSIIIEHLDRHHPGRTRFIPDDGDRAAQVRLYDRLFDLYVNETMQKIVTDRLRPAGAKDPTGVEHARARLDTVYRLLDGDLAARTWAAGDDFTMADCAAAPALFYADRVHPFASRHPPSRRLFRAPDGAAVLCSGGRRGEAVFPSISGGIGGAGARALPAAMRLAAPLAPQMGTRTVQIRTGAGPARHRSLVSLRRCNCRRRRQAVRSHAMEKDRIGDGFEGFRRASMTTGKHVAVLMGGWSAEREVSLRSGAACADALDRKGYRVNRIDVGRDIATVLAAARPEVALNVLHGRPGEDGTIQGILEIMAIPYSHSGVLASALAMQKDRAKDIMKAAGVSVPEGRVVSRFAASKEHALPRPYVIKPIAEGSSVGVFIVTEAHIHPPQELMREDWPFGEYVLCERFVAGKELTCAVMGDRALGVIEIVPTVRFYDYEAKYAPGGSTHLLPAPVEPKVYEEIRRQALAAHQALGCRGVSRADFRFDDQTGELACLEVNTQPGMTETSLVPEMAAHAGVPFDDLVAWMVEDASLNR